jgi:hypothetical protein
MVRNVLCNRGQNKARRELMVPAIKMKTGGRRRAKAAGRHLTGGLLR